MLWSSESTDLNFVINITVSRPLSSEMNIVNSVCRLSEYYIVCILETPLQKNVQIKGTHVLLRRAKLPLAPL